jgi:hypothetical protein
MEAAKFTTLVRTLFNTEQGRIRYAVKALPFAVIPAMVVSVSIGLLFDDLENPRFVDDLAVRPVFLFFFAVVIGPLLETLFMWPLIALLSLVTRNVWTIAVVSGAVWGLMHSLQVTQWGFSVFGSFVVLSIAFVEWRKKSLGSAILVPWMIHGMQNCIAVSLLLIVPPPESEGVPSRPSPDSNVTVSQVAKPVTNVIMAPGGKPVPMRQGSTLKLTRDGNEITIHGGERMLVNGREIMLPDGAELDVTNTDRMLLNGEALTLP